jgi:hypothetical protein
MNLIQEVYDNLIRADGKLNSPAIASKNFTDLITRVVEATNYLAPDASFSQRWWHLKNGINPPTCYCGRQIRWNDHSKYYPQYCSQQCAVTSHEARKRTQQTHKGKSHTTEQRAKQSKRMMGHSHAEATKQKLSEQKRGNKNPQYKKPPWNKGMFGSTNPNFGKRRPGTGKKGKNNPQYGKSPSPKAGRGITGKFNNQHFRSSLELLYLMYWWKCGISVTTAETKEFRVEYLTENGNIRTYSPDFYIEQTNVLVEIKPENLHSNKNVVRKMEALKNAHPHKHCKLMGFKDIGDFIREILENDEIENCLVQGVLEISEKQYDRLRKNYGDIIRATTRTL